MLNFIICDDCKLYLERIRNVIDSLMKEGNFDYHVYSFSCYDDAFMETCRLNLDNKIVILDIVVGDVCGVDVAREFRDYDDDSMLIFLSAHEDKYEHTIFKSTIKYDAFVSKDEDCLELASVLREKLNKLLLNSDVSFESERRPYVFKKRQVLYITTDKKERKSVIVTTHANYPVKKTLKELLELFGYPFFISKRSYIVNASKILSLDHRNGTILFDDSIHHEEHMLSPTYADPIKQYLSKFSLPVNND